MSDVIKSKKRALRMGAQQMGNPLPVLLDIRKGEPKKAGKFVGRELLDFRLCNFDEGDKKLMAYLERVGERVEPDDAPPYYLANNLLFVFPYPEPAQNLTTVNDCYKGKVLVHRCAADESRKVLLARDPKTLRVTVNDGFDVATGEAVTCNDEVIYTWTNKDGKTVEETCAPVTRLNVMLVGQGSTGVCQVKTGSPRDAKHLRDLLDVFYDAFSNSPIAKIREGGLRGVPFILQRTPLIDTVYWDGDERKIGKHSFITAIVSPNFGDLYLRSVVSSALEVVKLNMIEAPTDRTDDDNESLIDQAVFGDSPVLENGAPQSKALPAPATKSAAPTPQTPSSGDEVQANAQAALEGLGLSKSRLKALYDAKKREDGTIDYAASLAFHNKQKGGK